MRRPIFALPTLLSLGLAACASTGTVDRASELAKAGVAYAEAAPPAMDEATRITIEADAVNLAVQRDLGAVASGEEKRQALSDADRIIRTQIDVIGLLKKQTAQLGDYFVALGGLADSKAPAAAETATKAAVSNLEKIAPSLKSKSLPVPGGGSIAVADLIPAAANLIVRNAQNRAISEELTRNAGLIERQLALQEAAMAALSQAADDNLEIIYQDKLKNDVVDPYVGGEPLPSDWAERRVVAFAERAKPRAIGEAQAAAAKLRASWIAFAEDRLGRVQIEDLVESVTKLIDLLQAEKK